MSVAQRLYEAGKITYMRTDSVNMSDTALGEIAQLVQRVRQFFAAFGERAVKPGNLTVTVKYRSQGAMAKPVVASAVDDCAEVIAAHYRAAK